MKTCYILGLVASLAWNSWAVQVINLKSKDCSSDFTLPLNHEVTEVKAQPLFHFFNDTCMVTFSTADKFANIVFKFSESDGFKSYINSHITSILMYADDTSSNRVLLKNFTSVTSGDMVGDISDSKTLQTNRLTMVIINGNVGDAWPWAIHFTVKSADGPITDYPLSFACGVIALCLGGVTVLTLLCVACYCCCCSDKERARSERQERIIRQLRKEGYSVTRSYGAIGDTTPILRQEETRDIFSQPPPNQQQSRLPPPSGSQIQHDPPPPYHSVRSLSQAAASESYHPASNFHQISQEPSYNGFVFYHDAPSSRIRTLPAVEQDTPGTVSVVQQETARVIPEAILVEISTGQEQEDLMQFEVTTPDAPPLPAELLVPQAQAQPAFGEVN